MKYIEELIYEIEQELELITKNEPNEIQRINQLTITLNTIADFWNS